MDVSDQRLKIINDAAIKIMNSDRYDDLSQMVRMNHFSRSELAILLAVLNGEEINENDGDEVKKDA